MYSNIITYSEGLIYKYIKLRTFEAGLSDMLDKQCPRNSLWGGTYRV